MISLVIEDDGVTLRDAANGDAWGAWCPEVNLAGSADDAYAAIGDIGATRHVVCWSGWLGDTAFERDPKTWMPSGLAALNKTLDTVLPACEEASARLVLRPHARHVLCDPQRTLSFLRERAGQPIGVVLDAESFFEEEMEDRRDEHLARIRSSIGAIAVAMWPSKSA